MKLLRYRFGDGGADFARRALADARTALRSVSPRRSLRSRWRLHRARASRATPSATAAAPSLSRRRHSFCRLAREDAAEGYALGWLLALARCGAAPAGYARVNYIKP